MLSEKVAGCICIVIYIIVFAFILKLDKKFRFMGADKRPLEKAIKRGNVVTALHVPGSSRFRYIQRGTNKIRVYYANYEYEVDGKKYVKRGVSFPGMPSDTVQIYYVDNPAKGFLKGEHVGKKGRGIVTLLAYVIPLILAALVYGYLT